MAEWKMNKMLSSIWGKLEEKRDQRKLIKYKNWCALVVKKCDSTLCALKALESADMDKKEKLTMVTNKVIVGVNELIALLTTTVYKYDTSILTANPSLQETIRTALLDVWAPLLTSLPKLEFIDVTVVTQVHKAVLLLMCREEFSCEAFNSSKEGNTKEFILRYRNMLHSTLQTATQRLLDKPVIPAGSLQYAGPMNAMLNISFVAKVLAILYWRLPHVGAAIAQILEVPNMDLIAPVLSFPAFPEDACILAPQESPRGTNGATTTTTTSTSTSTSTSTTSTSTSTSTSVNFTEDSSTPTKTRHTPPKVSRGSGLLGWAALFKDLPPLHDDATVLLASPSVSSVAPPATPLSSSPSSSPTSSPSSSPPASPLLPPPTTWLGVLAKFDTTYVTFFKEWILHVKSALGRVEWSTVPGFPRLLQSLLYQMRIKEQPPPPLSKPYPLLDLQYTLLQQTNAELIDAFVKAAFLRTNVFDLMSVLNTLHLLEGWFTEILSNELILPSTFDINFFSTGIDVLLKSDHHQIVLRTIMLIYTFSEMFENAHRACLFDLLLSKYFYTLFMHWDPGVRNAFHQLLVFKMVRIKRSTLYNDGYVVKELSQVGLTSHQARDAQLDNNLSKSGSGFFSSISNVLPAFFSLSSSPDKSPSSTPTDKEVLSSSPNSDSAVSSNHANGAKDPEGQENASAKGTNDKANHNNTTENSGAGLEDGFVELSNSKSAERRATVGGDQITDAGPTPAPDEIDVQLFLKLNSYLKSIEDQLRKPTAKKVFEARLEPYGPIALAEFNQHLARYHQWELKNEDPPRFMSLPFARMGEG